MIGIETFIKRLILTVLALAALLAVVEIIVTDCRAEPPSIYGYDGRYLGTLSRNRFDPESVSNRTGEYGSRFNPDGINNRFGEYGSRFSPNSPNNRFEPSGGLLMRPGQDGLLY